MIKIKLNKKAQLRLDEEENSQKTDLDVITIKCIVFEYPLHA